MRYFNTKSKFFTSPLLLISGLALILQGCLNPFAPEIGEISGDIWHDQTSVGGLLRNFQTSYTLGDSLRYADLIAEEFEFQYFNVELNRYDQWYRDTELKTTGGLMRSVDRLDLRWGPWSDELDSLSLPDTTVEFTVNFSLSAGEYQPVFGFARFTVKADEDGLFRIHLWRDDF